MFPRSGNTDILLGILSYVWACSKPIKDGGHWPIVDRKLRISTFQWKEELSFVSLLIVIDSPAFCELQLVKRRQQTEVGYRVTRRFIYLRRESSSTRHGDESPRDLSRPNEFLNFQSAPVRRKRLTSQRHVLETGHGWHLNANKIILKP